MSTASILPIFIGLMKKRFTHIVRVSIVSFLMAGILAHLIIPFTSHAQKTAFTQWLHQNVVATGGESETELRNAIRSLTEETSDFRVLVEQASQLVASHKENFRLNTTLPVAADDQVTSWLVGQWNVFQYQQTGADAILPDTSLSVQKSLITHHFSNLQLMGTGFLTQTIRKAGSQTFYFITGKLMKPLESGISINAP